MSTQPPRGRQNRNGNSRGGRALMLLGIILALLAGVLVIYIVSNATQQAGATEQVVVATQPIPSGTIMGVPQIQADFAVKSYPVADVPSGAYIFSSQDALQVTLNNTVATQDIYPGDVLLTGDKRFSAVGTFAQGSLIAVNPSKLTPGDELFPLNYSNISSGGQNFVVAGDNVDIIVTECGAPYSTGCITNTVFKNQYVYAVFPSALILVLKQQQAQDLKLIMQTGNITLAIRKPGDNTNNTLTPVTPASIANQYFQ